jgi:HD superfamily phosphohydrolase
MYLARRGWRGVLHNSKVETVSDLRGEAVDRAVAVDGSAQALRDPAEFAAAVEDALGAVGLLHDVGHPPFSHVLEPFFAAQVATWLSEETKDLWDEVWAGQFHEAVGTLLMRSIIARLDLPRRILTRGIYEADPDGGSAFGVLHSIVAGEVDVDRLDYLMRDAQKAGTEFGAIDWERLIDALEVRKINGAFRVAPTYRARSAVETLLVQRTQSYKWIIFHHKVVGTNLALQRAVDHASRLSALSGDATAFEQTKPISDWFDPHRPNLNYITPALHAVDRAARIDLADVAKQTADRLVADAAATVQASVDDPAVVEWLKGTALVARLLDRHAATIPPELRIDAKRLGALTNVALWRTNQLVSAWKTLEDFDLVADQLIGKGLRDRLLAACDAVVDSQIEDGRKAGVRRYRETFSELLTDTDRRVTAVNLLLEILLSKRKWTNQLELRLQSHAPQVLGQDGFWLLHYTGFRPIYAKGQLAALFHTTRTEPIPVRATSPLVAALENAEAQRPRLFAFFVLLNEVSPAPLTQIELQRYFVEGIWEFLGEMWPSFVDGLAFI